MTQLSHEKQYAPGSVRQLLSISLPMVVSCACDTLMMFIDRLFLSDLGSQYMSAALGGGVTCFMFMTYFIGLTGYSNALVAQHLGAGQKNRCALVTTQALILCFIAYPLILSCIPLGKMIFEASGIDPLQLKPQYEYFYLVAFSTIFGLLRNTFSAFFSGIGRTRIVMVAALSAMVVNVFANYLLIFGNLGFPAMGIRGAAIGTIIGTAVSVGILCAVYFGHKNREEFSIMKNLRFAREMMTKLIRMGSSFGVELLLNVMAFNFMVMVFHSYGVDIAAAVTIAFNWDMVAFIPLIGVEIGVTSLVGRYMGKSDPDLAHKVTKSGLKLATLYCFAILVLFLIFARPLVEIFKPEDGTQFMETTQPLGIFMVQMVSVYVMALGLMIVFAGALRGAGDTFWTMIISIFGHWVMAVTVISMSWGFKFTAKTTWVGMVAAVIFLAMLFVLRYRQGRWRTLKVIEEEPMLPEIQSDAQVNV